MSEPLFACFKIAAFVVLELSLAALFIVVIIALVRARVRMNNPSPE